MKTKQILIALAITLAIPAAPAQALTYRSDLSSIATSISGRPTRVYCAKTWGEWNAVPDVHYARTHGLDPQGVTNPLTARIDLDPGICLGTTLHDDPLNMGNAAIVIAHESGHVASPTATEAHVECMAWKRTPRVIRSLWPNATRKLQRAIAHQALIVHDEIARFPGYDWHGAC